MNRVPASFPRKARRDPGTPPSTRIPGPLTGGPVRGGLATSSNPLPAAFGGLPTPLFLSTAILVAAAGVFPRHPADRTASPRTAQPTYSCALPEDIRARLRARDRRSPAVQEAVDALECELEALGGHAWAGMYYSGDHLGRNAKLWITPSGFAYSRHGCLGLYDQQHGSVQVFGDTLVLEPASSDDRPDPDRIGSDPALPAILTPVRRPLGSFLVRPHELDALEEYLAAQPSSPDWPEDEFFRRQDP